MYDSALVAQAFFLTAVVVIGLTVYTFTAKTDFKWLGATMTSLLGIMLVAGISQVTSKIQMSSNDEAFSYVIRFSL